MTNPPLRRIDEWGYRICYAFIIPINWLLTSIVRTHRDSHALRVAHVSVLSTKPFIKTRVLRELGVRADYIVPRGRGWLKVGEPGCDRYLGMDGLPRFLRPFLECYYFWKELIHYDIYHIHFLASFSESMWDVECLKKLGKKLIFHFRGCDIRDEETNDRKNPNLNCCQECTHDREYCAGKTIRMKREKARRYGDVLLVTTPDLLDFVPDATHLPFMNIFLNPAVIPNLERDRSVVRIVHATNHEGIDGTQYIRDAVEALKRMGYPIDFLVVKRIPHIEALALYKSADICVGKLRQGYYSNFQIESMALGKPTLCYIRREFLEKLPSIPIVNTTPSTVFENLKALLDDPNLRRNLGEQGKRFVRDYHDNQLIGRALLNMYEGLMRPDRHADVSSTATRLITLDAGEKKVAAQ